MGPNVCEAFKCLTEEHPSTHKKKREIIPNQSESKRNSVGHIRLSENSLKTSHEPIAATGIGHRVKKRGSSTYTHIYMYTYAYIFQVRSLAGTNEHFLV